MSDHSRAPYPPPRLKDPAPTGEPPALWARLPADRRRQLQRLLGQLLARLLEARRLKEAGHD